MLAASYFSLLAPAIVEANGLWPGYDWVVASVGFLLGGGVMILAEIYMPDDVIAYVSPSGLKVEEDVVNVVVVRKSTRRSSSSKVRSTSKSRKKKGKDSDEEESESPRLTTTTKSSKSSKAKTEAKTLAKQKSWKRILLLVMAISLHNAPEGGAVGVAFGSLTNPKTTMTFDSAWSVAIGIGLQNFPEGLAVSLPLRREGCSLKTAFFWGQLSGMVEIVSGFLGAYLVKYATVCLPIALSAAAGAMVHVVCSELLPEAHGSGNDRAVNIGVLLGFVLMMAMDVSLG